jgi:dUTP pyrophosphatase
MKIKLDKGAFAPERKHPRDAGLDLKIPDIFIYRNAGVIVPSFGSAFIDTGVHVELPAGYVGLVKSRSGLFVNHNVTTDGVIDENYRGSIGVHLINHSDTPLKLRAGDRIAQLVIVRCDYTDVEIVDKLSDTDRGNDGFGSTGVE